MRTRTRPGRRWPPAGAVEAVEAAAEGGEAFAGGVGERVVPAAVHSVGIASGVTILAP